MRKKGSARTQSYNSNRSVTKPHWKAAGLCGIGRERNSVAVEQLMFASDFPPLHGTLLDLAGYCLLVYKGRALACVSVGNEGFFLFTVICFVFQQISSRQMGVGWFKICMLQL